MSRTNRFSLRTHARTPLALALVAALGIAPLAAQAATIAVTYPGDINPAYTGICTFRQAIKSMYVGYAMDACSNTSTDAFGTNNTIVFATTYFPADGSGSITLAYGKLLIAGDLTIDASANSNVTINANGASRVILDTAAAGSSLTLKHLTLRNGVAPADFNGKSLGGAILTFSANLTLADSTVSDSSAGDNGGGIYSGNGSITLTDSTISDNSATNHGGGIYSENGSVTLTDSTVSDNTAHDDGGGIYTKAGSVTLTDSTVSGNTALNAKFTSNGGGIFSEDSNVILNNSTVSDNFAYDGGGGIFTKSGSITLTNSTVSGNTAFVDGGAGIYVDTENGSVTLTNSTVSGNSASGSGRGGAIFARNGGITLTNSTITGNFANWYGGGIYVSSDTQPITLQQTTIAGNTSTSSGGGLRIQTSGGGSVTFNGALFANNTASTNGGGNIAVVSGSITVVGAGNLVFGGGLLNTTFSTAPLTGDPKLSTLGDFGGPTLTMLPEKGSAAVDATSCTGAPLTDQRGVLRPQVLPTSGAKPWCDIGAVEVDVIDRDPIFADGFE